jgi:poly [ADP-ribose] polymerase
MAAITKEAKYIKSDFRNNNNKFWYIYVYDDDSVTTEYGRVGKNPQSRTKDFGSQDQALRFFESKCKEKERDGRNGEIGYRPIDIVAGTGSGGSSTVSIKEDVGSIAQDEIDSDSPETKALIRYLAKVNIHNITQNTTMTYNKVSGLFETPCGIVTADSIKQARGLLTSIGDHVSKDDLSTDTYGELLNDYLMLIPQDIGMKFIPENIYRDLSDVQKQNDILDSLDASLQTVLSSPADKKAEDKKAKREKVFATKLFKVEDKKIIDRVRKKYKETRKDMHVCAHLDVKTVYIVEIEAMKNAFEKKGKGVGNVMELWHGTRAANVLSIMKGGLYIPPSNASHCTGRMFGNGAYFAHDSTKSLNYSYGYWGGSGYDKNCFMFLADVAMGNYYVPSNYRSSLPAKGYDSTWAKSNKSGVRNDEYIVYTTDQCNLTYLIEFA